MFVLSDPERGFVTVHLRQNQVHKHHVIPLVTLNRVNILLDSFGPVAGHSDLDHTQLIQDYFEPTPAKHIVFHK